jgi:hypothetical protein
MLIAKSAALHSLRRALGLTPSALLKEKAIDSFPVQYSHENQTRTFRSPISGSTVQSINAQTVRAAIGDARASTATATANSPPIKYFSRCDRDVTLKNGPIDPAIRKCMKKNESHALCFEAHDVSSWDISGYFIQFRPIVDLN